MSKMFVVRIQSLEVKLHKLEEWRNWANQLKTVNRDMIIENLVANENTISFDAGFESGDEIPSEDIKNIVEKFVETDEYFEDKPNVSVIEKKPEEHIIEVKEPLVKKSTPESSLPTVPPFTVRSIVKLCWGMTLNLSHIKQQNEIGSELNKQLFSLLGDNIDKAFLRNLIMVLSQSLRTIAFSRDAHVRHLNENALSLAEKEKFWDELTQLTSFSKQGLPVQILSFLGGGSVGVLNFISQLINPSASQNLTQAAQSVNNVGKELPNYTNALSNLSEAISNTTHALQPSSSLQPIFITNFILYGVIGVIVATIVLKVIGWVYIHIQKNKVQSEQDRYYKEQFKNGMIESLFNFYVDVKDLVDRYYPSYPDIDEFKEQNEDQIKSYIGNKILPSDKIQWSRWLKDSST